MKIGILTRRAGYNMGSTLQAYAMYKLFSKFGKQVEILDYDEYNRFLMWRVKPVIDKILYIILNCFYSVLSNSLKDKHLALKRTIRQRQRFSQFEQMHFPLTKAKYRNSKDLQKTKDCYDAYVCGSDQIWSPAMYDPAFYLDFASSDGVSTIAYAPSLGVTESRLVSEEAKNLINRVDFISCREKEGATVLSEITGKEIPVVLDPTLMIDLDDWEKINLKSKIVEGDYILTYFLHTRFFEDNIPNKFIQRLKNATGAKVVNIQMHNMQQVVNADEHLYDCGPSEFLSLISNSKYVVTNSFHCCVFSFIYRKKFFVFERYRKGDVYSNQNPRIHTLLETINSMDSLVKDEDRILDLENYQAEQNLELYNYRKKQSFEFMNSALRK